MKYRNFKPFGSISALTLGGGGIGNVWGKTTRREAVDTVLYAIDSGKAVMDLLEQNIRPRDIVTKQSFINVTLGRISDENDDSFE